MMDLLLLLLPVASASGWYMGRKSQKTLETSSPKNSFHRDYFIGLNYLINEQPDKAVDVFIKLLDVDRDTIETHLALGSLYRRRGEVDRAIRIHQNLISRSQLADSQRIQALHELAQDYLRAGVLDQAERIFLQLVDENKEVISSLRYLMSIYQQQKDWSQAIKIAQDLEQATCEPMKPIIAHYHCEIADLHFQKNKLQDADDTYTQALHIDKNCVRASLASAKIAMLREDYEEAIQNFKRVKIQDADYLSETIPPIRMCYERLAKIDDLIAYLQECLAQHPRVAIMIAISEYLQQQQGNRAAINFIAQQLHRHPSLRGLDRLIDLYFTISEGDAKDKLLLLRSLVATLLAEKPSYRCIDCGFATSTLYWLCPGCKHWNTVRPTYGMGAN